MENSSPIGQIVVIGQADNWFCSPKHYKCNSKEFILVTSMFFFCNHIKGLIPQKNEKIEVFD